MSSEGERDHGAGQTDGREQEMSDAVKAREPLPSNPRAGLGRRGFLKAVALGAGATAAGAASVGSAQAQAGLTDDPTVDYFAVFLFAFARDQDFADGVASATPDLSVIETQLARYGIPRMSSDLALPQRDRAQLLADIVLATNNVPDAAGVEASLTNNEFQEFLTAFRSGLGGGPN